MPGSLTGVRVLEVGESKGLAYAGKLLCNLGAEVITVEPPGGSALRAYGPFPGDAPHPERSGFFLYCHGGKRSTRLDLERAGDREALHTLLAGADVLLHGYQPAAAARLGLEAGALLGRYPRLIVTALTPYGSTGPNADWRGYAIQAQAGTGIPIRVGDQPRGPITSALDQAEIQHGAVQAAAATVLALVHRARIGVGQFVDIAVMEAVATAVSSMGLAAALYRGTPPPRRPGRAFGAGPWGIYDTLDGAFDVITQQSPQWQRFLELMGEPEWARDERFRHVRPSETMQRTPEEIRVWRQALTEWFAQRTSAEVWSQTRAHRISFQPLHTIGQVIDSDHVVARGLMVEAPGAHPPLRVPGPPYRMSVTPWELPGPPPRLDDPPAVAWQRPSAPALAPQADAPDDDRRLPLAGMRVIDLTQVWAGPLLARYLADYGADVITVETASRPRELPSQGDPDGPAPWESFYRNRRSVHLDLRRPEAVRLFKGLLATADVLVDNFTPRVMPGLGMPYEALAAEFPRLVIAALSATGRDGPWSDLLTYGPALTALYGTKSLHGYPPDDVMEDVADLDPISAGYGMLAIMAALHHRDRTGQGQMIEIAQGELALCGLAEAAIEHVWNGRHVGPQGNLHRVLAPHGFYRCAGEDRWVAIACGSDAEWAALARAAGHAEWLERAEFRTAADRRAHRDEIDAAISAWTAAEQAEEIVPRLQAAGVAAMPAMTTLEIIADPQHSQRRAHFRLHPQFPAPELYAGNPWHFSIAAPLLRCKAPEAGQDSDAVFRELLGLSGEEIARLRAEGAIA